MARIDHYRDGKWVRSLELLQRSYLVGRDPAADLVLDGPLCSRRHLQLNWVGGAFVMEDLDTSNGTIVDGVREYNRRLSSNATTQIGVDLLLFRPDAEGTAPPEDDELPGWAFKGLDEATLTLSATGQMAPAELVRLQARTRLRTRPHLLRRIRNEEPEIFSLDLDVTPIGYGSVKISVGPGKDRVVAEVLKTKTGYRIKAKALFGKITVNGAARRESPLAPRDRIAVEGLVLEFHPGLEGKGA